MTTSSITSIPAALVGLHVRLAAAVADAGERTPLNLGTDEPVRAATTGSGGGLVRTLVGLMIVVGVIYGVYWLLRQAKGARSLRASGSGLGSIATVPLGQSASLHLVHAGRELVLLGVGQQGVAAIRTYSEEEALELGLLAAPPEDGAEPPAGPPQIMGSSRNPLVRGLDRLRKMTVVR